MKALRRAATTALVIASGLAAWCCGPKPAPQLELRCPEEACVLDEYDGSYSCTCPE